MMDFDKEYGHRFNDDLNGNSNGDQPKAEPETNQSQQQRRFTGVGQVEDVDIEQAQNPTNKKIYAANANQIESNYPFFGLLHKKRGSNFHLLETIDKNNPTKEDDIEVMYGG